MEFSYVEKLFAVVDVFVGVDLLRGGKPGVVFVVVIFEFEDDDPLVWVDFVIDGNIGVVPVTLP